MVRHITLSSECLASYSKAARHIASKSGVHQKVVSAQACCVLCIMYWLHIPHTTLQLGEIRSIIPDTVHVMATATKTTRELCMQRPAISPQKQRNKAQIADTFEPLVAALLREGRHLGRVIIFCRTYDDVTSMYTSKKSSRIPLERLICQVSIGRYVHT